MFFGEHTLPAALSPESVIYGKKGNFVKVKTETSIRQNEPSRDRLPTAAKRLTALSLCFAVALTFLLFQIFRLQVFLYDFYRDKVFEQITTSSALRAQRGNILDRNGNILAKSETVWRVFLSSREIKKAEKSGRTGVRDKIADGLSSLLGLDRGEVMKKIDNTDVLDLTIKKKVSEEEYKKLLSWIKKERLDDLVFAEAQTSRSYPGGVLAAHVLGFTGADNQGLYGLEYQYDDLLAGTDGVYLYAKDAGGNALPDEYATYLPATDGCSLVTTLDSYLQSVLESEIETVRQNHLVNNRVTAIVMDVESGAILAMATSSPFDPNSPYELDEQSKAKLAASGYAEGSDKYKAYKTELRQIMWSNKAVSETYEPGSTFKIVTVSTALDVGAATMNDRFSCTGAYMVGGWRIRCHKAGGHGSGFPLSYGLQMSCNPTMMQIAERIGSDRFYDYVEKFGYLEKTGIDLPSEARTIFHNKENIGPTELATASFGQRFKVTPIRQLVSIASVANGGKLVTPYLVDRVLDADGNTVFEHKTHVVREVIREEVAAEISAVLEAGVSGDGGAKNARVPGYKIAAKTGTSQKFDLLDVNGNSYLRIGSTVAYAPSDSSGIAMILIVDEPTSQVKYGSTVAAPYVASFLEKALPYLGFASDAERLQVTVENLAGLPVTEAKKRLADAGLSFEVIGNGGTVVSQIPAPGAEITSAYSRVLLYTVDREEKTLTVPDFLGMDAATAASTAVSLGLNLRIVGNFSAKSDGSRVIGQSIAKDTRVKKGSVLILTVQYLDFED